MSENKRVCKSCQKELAAGDTKTCSHCGVAITMSESESEVVEMATRCDAIELTDKSSEKKEVWLQLAKQGSFKGHHSGIAFEMNAQTFTEIIRNFEASSNRAIPVDFEHASEAPPTSGSIPHMGAPAQGWISKLELRACGNLYGLCSWGDLAKTYIRGGQYRFLSPAVVFGAKDRVTGKVVGARLTSVALTNNPFLDGMQPVAARAAGTSIVENEKSKSFSAIVCKALSLPSSMENVQMLNGTLRAFQGASTSEDTATLLREALRLPLTMSANEVFSQARVACGEVLPPVGDAKDTSPAVSAALAENQPKPAKESIQMSDGKNKDTEVSELTLKLTAAQAETSQVKVEMSAKLASLETENTDLKLKLSAFEEKEVARLVDTAIATHEHLKKDAVRLRPHLMTMAMKNRESFDAMYPLPAPGTEYLGQNITGNPVPHNNGGGNLGANNGGGNGPRSIRLRDVITEEKIPTVETLANKFITEAKAIGMSMGRDEAFGKAHVERTNLINAAANKRAGIGV